MNASFVNDCSEKKIKLKITVRIKSLIKKNFFLLLIAIFIKLYPYVKRFIAETNQKKKQKKTLLSSHYPRPPAPETPALTRMRVGNAPGLASRGRRQPPLSPPRARRTRAVRGPPAMFPPLCLIFA